MMIILSVVFSNLFKFDVENYSVYLLSGQLIFNFYSESTTMSMSAILDNGPLIKKIYVPKYLFVVSRVFSSTINLLASFTALICVMLATPGASANSDADRSACPTVHITEGDCSAAVAAVARRHAAIPENNVFLMVWVCWLIKCSYNFGVK